MTMSCNVARFSSAPSSFARPSADKSERSTFNIQYPGLRKASALGYNLVCASRLNSETAFNPQTSTIDYPVSRLPTSPTNSHSFHDIGKGFVGHVRLRESKQRQFEYHCALRRTGRG